MVLFTAMFDSNGPTPQFNTAEYVGTPTADVCQVCKQPISEQYYRVGGGIACDSCAEIARQRSPQDSHSAYGQALGFGIGAALAGMIGYAILTIILRGWTIGYISLGVGYIVGKAMMFGSNGLGGRRYQITAALLTYAAVSIAAVPAGIYLYRQQHTQTGQEQALAEQKQFEKEFGKETTKPLPPRQGQAAVRPHMNFWPAVGVLALEGFISPFLRLLQNPISGVIGLVILFVGIQIAWKITGGTATPDVSGPYASVKRT
jgi:hypothetical protein